MAFEDVGVNVEPILILVSCRLFIGVVCEADSKINLHVPPLFHSADQEPGDKEILIGFSGSEILFMLLKYKYSE